VPCATTEVSVSSPHVSEHSQGPGSTRGDSATTVRPRNETLDGILAPPDDPAFYLVAIDGPRMGRWIQLGETPITAGRDPHLDITLFGNDISRRHLLATVMNGAVVVEDLGSTNGTFIDGQRVVTRATLPAGGLLRVGDHTFRCERCGRREMQRATDEQRSLERAANYVQSLLSQPLVDGPVRTEWIFRPSARLGGDAFGCEPLDAQTFAIYLLDVCGHGVGAAMHSVSVLNVLRQRALPATDFRDPIQVLAGLNTMFQMDSHDGLYFTIWYGVYDSSKRLLSYASAGHHPGFLLESDTTDALPLKTSGLMIGAIPDPSYLVAETTVPGGGRLYLFSDGLFEVVTPKGPWGVGDFVELLGQPLKSGASECQRLYKAVRAACHPWQFDDDVSLLVVTFP
jgi:Stage II sporulation protein E (SpoIIE)/FHA domain